jgi:hypothetical protein
MRKLMAKARKKREENTQVMDLSARLDVENNHVVAEGQDPDSNPTCFPKFNAQGQPLEQRNDRVT